MTRRLKAKIRELAGGLPTGVRIVPFYDRTPLIQGAVGTVTGTVVEAMVAATICVLLVLLHPRASLVIALTLAAGGPGVVRDDGVLRRLGHRRRPDQRHVAGRASPSRSACWSTRRS